MKKSQTTIFIILAIFIILVLFLFFFFNKKINKTKSDSSEYLANVDSQVRPVYVYINDDFKELIKNGLEILRLQGGYIYLPKDTPIIEIETEGKHVYNKGGKIELIKGSGKTKIPLWVSKNRLEVPSKEFMEKQLEKYISENLEKINFKSFEKKGMNVKTEQPKINISLGNPVIVKLKYPTNIRFKNKGYRFEDFKKTIDLDFNSIYDTAIKLVVYEQAYSYLEYHASSLISLYSYAGGPKQPYDLPPWIFVDTNTNCNYVSWTKNEVLNDLSTIFAQDFQYLKMANTDFKRIYGDDRISQGVYDSFIKSFFEKSNENKNMHIDFSYSPENKLDLEITPSNLVPEKQTKTDIPFLPSLCTFKYKFYYTLSAPILVKIYNKKSIKPNGEKYEFYFPMDLYICNNGKRRCKSIKKPNVNLKILENITKQKYFNCKDIFNEIEIDVKDSFGNELDGVNINSFCEGYANNCWLGQTENGKAILNLPRCKKPSLLLYKNGYKKYKGIIKSNYVLKKLKNFNLKIEYIKARDFAINYFLTKGFTKPYCGKNPEDLFKNTIHPPANKDKIILMFSGIDKNFVQYPETKSIKLSEGKINLTSLVTSDVNIAPSNYNGNWISFNKDNPQENYNGKWVLGSASYNFLLNSDEIKNKKNITIYVLVEHLSQDILEVKNFDNPFIKNDSLSGTVDLDVNCDGHKQKVNINISKQDYLKFLKPKFK